MPIDASLTSLFATKEAALLVLGILLFTYILRTVVEGAWPAVNESRAWAKVLLPLGPIVNGMMFALASKSMFWPESVKGDFLARVIYGGGCGVMAGWGYSRFRDFQKEHQIPSAAEMMAPAKPGAVVTLTPSEPVPPSGDAEENVPTLPTMDLSHVVEPEVNEARP